MNNIKTVDNSVYRTTIVIGANKIKQVCWYFTNILFFKNSLVVSSAFKVFLLKLFGAKVGRGVILKPGINIKFPWKLSLGNYTWIGEAVWIDNLAFVNVGDNVCISQGALLLTGNHNFKKTSFDLMLGEIILEDGVWIGANAIVCPGVCCRTHAVLSAGSVANANMDSYTVYKGNPAVIAGKRIIG